MVFCPDDRPPRIIRFTTLPGDFLARYDEENNLLLVDRAKYSLLTKDEQEMVLRTQRPKLQISTTSNVPTHPLTGERKHEPERRSDGGHRLP